MMAESSWSFLPVGFGASARAAATAWSNGPAWGTSATTSVIVLRFWSMVLLPATAAQVLAAPPIAICGSPPTCGNGDEVSN